ncbi:hypothetical protein GQX74_002001 [Glossina fuscipes]|nr:hypothetical protein GQX74_002001 [Glossina fuscipes]
MPYIVGVAISLQFRNEENAENSLCIIKSAENYTHNSMRKYSQDANLSLLLRPHVVLLSPTTVQMVSQNRAPPPPMPVPVQVSQGQVMQQYVNENGTLTHVVLSPQQYQQLHAGQGHIPPPFCGLDMGNEQETGRPKFSHSFYNC